MMASKRQYKLYKFKEDIPSNKRSDMIMDLLCGKEWTRELMEECDSSYDGFKIKNFQEEEMIS